MGIMTKGVNYDDDSYGGDDDRDSDHFVNDGKTCICCTDTNPLVKWESRLS